MSCSQQISEDIFTKVLNDHICQSDMSEEREPGRIIRHRAVGDTGVYFRRHVEIVE